MNDKTEKTRFHEKLCAEEVINFSVHVYLLAFFSIKIVSWY